MALTPAPRHCLPPELHDYILDYQSTDKSVLSVCALVCRAWCATSQFHLFDTVVITHHAPLPAFVAFLEQTPHVRGLVRRLLIQGEDEGRLLQVTQRELARCLATLPALRTLRLKGVWCSGGDDADEDAPDRSTIPDLADIPAGTRTLKHLHLARVVMSPGVLFGTVLGSFSDVSVFRVERLLWVLDSSYQKPGSSVALVKPIVRALDIGSGMGNSLRVFLATLHQRTDLGKLERLSFEVEHIYAWRELVQFAHQVAPVVSELAVSIGEHISGDEAKSQLQDLEIWSWPDLSSFKINLPAHRTEYTWDILLTTLAQLPRALQGIVIEGGIQTHDSNREWSMLDEMLVSKNFRLLREVRVAPDRPARDLRHCAIETADDLWGYLSQQKSEERNLVGRRLPQVNSKGILLIV